MEESSLEFTSHPVSQHICYTIQKKCLILHFPFTVAPCFLCFLFPSHNVTQYTKCWKNSCCLIKKDSINEISNFHSIINLLNYLYLERNLNICHYGNDLGRGGKSVRICVCVCISICLHIQVCIYICCWNGKHCHFSAGFLFSHGCHRKDEVSAEKKIRSCYQQ